MRKLLALAFILCSCLPAAAQSKLYANSIIVCLKPGQLANALSGQTEITRFGDPEIDALNLQFKTSSINRIITGSGSAKDLFTLTYTEKADAETVAKAYQKTGFFIYTEPNYLASAGGTKVILPNDPNFPDQWSLKNNGNFLLSPAKAGADIKMTDAWDLGQGDPNQTLCIIDSGCKLDHPEFAGRIWQNTGEIPNNNYDDDGNGLVDDYRGWDFVNQDNNPTDDHGHGTNVTGIAAATGNNGTGYAGINWRCKIMVLKVLDNQNNGTYANMTSAIYYAVNQGAKVINMSIGGTSYSQTLKDAVDFAVSRNVVFVACMMNTNSATPYYPAAYSNTIAVGATNPNDTRSNPFSWSATSGSNYGNHISVVAPGNYIYGLHYLSNTNYNTYWAGTSQAAPMVAGLASLLLAQNPNRSPAQIRQIIESTADDQVGNPLEDVAGWDPYFGFGRINADRALRQVLGTSRAPETAKPDFQIFPNPTSGKVFITSLHAPGNQDELTVSNILGQVVIREKLESETSSITLPGPGIYLLTTTHNKKQKSCKIVVQ